VKKVIPLLSSMILLLFSPASVAAFPSVPGEVLVKYRAGTYPRHLKGPLAKIGWAKITIGKNETLHEAMGRLNRQSDIEHIEPNTRGEFLADPDDPRLNEQRYLPAIKAPEAWDTSLGSGVIIGLVDSGVDLDHEDLAGNILPNGWDFGDDDDDPGDELGHGTQVCGIIAAVQNNGRGISGVAPQSKILPLKISLGNTDIFTDETVAEAIMYAADNGAAIINLSLGWNDDEDHAAVTDAIAYAAEKGVVLVAAAGNRYGPVWYPARLEQVLAVSAIDGNEQNIYSAYGPELDLVAPGSGNTLDDFILTTAMGGGYTFNKGTSLSAAMVSGVAALLLSEQPHLTNDQAAAFLMNRADDLGDPGKDELFGSGRVNALATLDPLVSFVFPGRIAGSNAMPFVYLLALFGHETQFLPLFSRVSFSSAYLSPLGPPVVALPRLLLQLVMLKPDAPEGFSDVTVTTGNEDAEGYHAIYIIRPRMSAVFEGKRLQTN
jgi:subtilisin family serine protease